MATNQKVGGSSPSWRATSEQSPLCSDVFFCLRHKIPERPSAEGFSRPVRSRTKIPAGEAQRDFPCPHESSCTSCNLLGQKALAGFLRTSYPRSRSANSAKNRLGVCKTPILLRKTAFLAARDRAGQENFSALRAPKFCYLHATLLATPLPPPLAAPPP